MTPENYDAEGAKLLRELGEHVITSGHPKAKFTGLPLVVGCYVLSGDWRIYVTKKPRWLTRVMVRWFFEWKWEDV